MFVSTEPSYTTSLNTIRASLDASNFELQVPLVQTEPIGIFGISSIGITAVV